jgi:hypothetical protein
MYPSIENCCIANETMQVRFLLENLYLVQVFKNKIFLLQAERQKKGKNPKLATKL